MEFPRECNSKILPYFLLISIILFASILKLHKSSLKSKYLSTQKMSDQCQVKLGHNNQFPTILLLSFPGSGNTWVRFLIEQSTGFLTGSVYNDRNLQVNLLGELEDPKLKNTIVVKSHITGLSKKDKKEKSIIEFLKPSACIFIMRNPKNAILADFSRNLHRSHTTSLSEQDLKNFNQNWAKFKKIKKEKGGQIWFTGWAEHYSRNVIENVCGGKVEIIWYERIKESFDELVGALNRTVGFLNRMQKNNSIKFRPNCLINNNQGFYHRKHLKTNINNDVENYFTESEKIEANALIGQVNDTFVDKFGLEAELPIDYFFRL